MVQNDKALSHTSISSATSRILVAVRLLASAPDISSSLFADVGCLDIRDLEHTLTKMFEDNSSNFPIQAQGWVRPEISDEILKNSGILNTT